MFRLIRKIMSLMSNELSDVILLQEFYFVRHGQTDANLQGIMCGGMWDLELNQTGLTQAQVAAQRFKEKVKDLQRICVSPLKRAQQTAGYFSELYAHLPLEKIEELREWKIGSWEKALFESIKDDFLGTGEPEGGETRKQFRGRVHSALKICQTKPGPFLMVSHGGVGLALQEILGLAAAKVENCVPHHIFRSQLGCWKVETI